MSFPLKHVVSSVLIYLYQASARVDLAGGWSDTPPISYEMGGEVLNLAIRIHGRKPMGAKVSQGDTKALGPFRLVSESFWKREYRAIERSDQTPRPQSAYRALNVGGCAGGPD
jgi:hypothetical protein